MDYSDGYILVKIPKNLTEQGPNVAVIQDDINNKQVIFKNSAPFTVCTTQINNTQIEDAKDFEVVILMYDLIEYSNNYSVTTASLWQYHKHEAKSLITYLFNYNYIKIITCSFKCKSRFLANTNKLGI